MPLAHMHNEQWFYTRNNRVKMPNCSSIAGKMKEWCNQWVKMFGVDLSIVAWANQKDSIQIIRELWQYYHNSFTEQNFGCLKVERDNK